MSTAPRQRRLNEKAIEPGADYGADMKIGLDFYLSRTGDLDGGLREYASFQPSQDRTFRPSFLPFAGWNRRPAG